MTGQPVSKLVTDRRYVDPKVAMARFLEIANGLEADKGRIPIGPIDRTMLDEGASVAEYRAGLARAIAEGLIEIQQRPGFAINATVGLKNDSD